MNDAERIRDEQKARDRAHELFFLTLIDAPPSPPFCTNCQTVMTPQYHWAFAWPIASWRLDCACRSKHHHYLKLVSEMARLLDHDLDARRARERQEEIAALPPLAQRLFQTEEVLAARREALRCVAF